ncbi:MAG TPA: hypothetical protein VM142_07030 [Acidimicrobiales bacterium]|nr:hypothetical protein [Acidimicrobiales bacterium]
MHEQQVTYHRTTGTHSTAWLIAQAMTDGLVVVTRDVAFEDYDVETFAC